MEKVRDIYGVTYEEYGEIYTEFAKAIKQLLYFFYINCFKRCEDAEGKEIRLYINSPGGDVYSEKDIISIQQAASGVKLFSLLPETAGSLK